MSRQQIGEFSLSTSQTTHKIWPTNHAWNSSIRFDLSSTYL